MNETDQLNPAGLFAWPEEILTPEEVAPYIKEIESFPGELRAALWGFSQEQMETKTLPGVWTVSQVVHHLADSHMNSLTRFKLALTEEKPIIKPYFEDRWADLSDSREAPAQLSLQLLEALHERWVILLRSLTQKELKRKFFHPEADREISISDNITLYAWHGRHHLGHINLLKEKMGW